MVYLAQQPAKLAEQRDRVCCWWCARGANKILDAVLAWAWDSVPSKQDVLDGILICDDRIRDMALAIIVGRCHYGRPVEHPRRDAIRAISRLPVEIVPGEPIIVD